MGALRVKGSWPKRGATNGRPPCQTDKKPCLAKKTEFLKPPHPKLGFWLFTPHTFSSLLRSIGAARDASNAVVMVRVLRGAGGGRAGTGGPTAGRGTTTTTTSPYHSAVWLRELRGAGGRAGHGTGGRRADGSSAATRGAQHPRGGGPRTAASDIKPSTDDGERERGGRRGVEVVFGWWAGIGGVGWASGGKRPHSPPVPRGKGPASPQPSPPTPETLTS